MRACWHHIDGTKANHALIFNMDLSSGTAHNPPPRARARVKAHFYLFFRKRKK